MKYIIGIDEVGRGPLAGPVTLCACIIPKSFKIENIFEDGKIKDSKKLKKDSRQKIYQTILKLRKLEIIDFAVSSRSAEYIDKNGISKAIKSCIKSILNSPRISVLGAKATKMSGTSKCRTILAEAGIQSIPRNRVAQPSIKCDVEIVLDGSLHAPIQYKNQKTIIKGDEKELSIALASIIAKNTRDSYMEKLAKQINNYDWHNNMGYGTAKHMENIKKHGVTKYHRKTYIK